MQRTVIEFGNFRQMSKHTKKKNIYAQLSNGYFIKVTLKELRKMSEKKSFIGRLSYIETSSVVYITLD